ncbi:MAG: glycosyltransferase [Gemmatimonadota bacterium]
MIQLPLRGTSRAPTRSDPTRPRILHLINSLGAGGAERSLSELLPIYAAAGIDSVITCLKTSHEGFQGLVEAGSFDLRFVGARSLPRAVLELRDWIRAEPVDLIHTTLFESDIAGRLAAVNSGIPVLTSLVNTSYAPSRRLDPNVRRGRLWVTRLADALTARYLTSHFHAITQAVKDSAVHSLYIPPQRITVVERGRDPARLGERTPERTRRARRNLGLAGDDEVIVAVGRQEFQKGHRYLLQAMARLVPLRPRLRLLVAGRAGHATDELHRLHRELSLADHVRFLGHRDDVPEILAAADLFVFPSIYEGLGGALIEAMGLGLPVVATRIPSTREVVEERVNALLVAPGASNDLAEAILALLNDPERSQAFGRHSARIFAERFTLERSARRMIDLYETIIARRSSRR